MVPLRVGILDEDQRIEFAFLECLEYAASFIVAPVVAWMIGVDEKNPRL